MTQKTAIEKGIDLIKSKGSARSPELAIAMGAKPTAV